jgi:uncharacterized protein YegL
MDTIDQQLDALEEHFGQFPVLCGVVIDRSGSMGKLTQDTIAGFNEFLSEQRRHPGKLLVHLTLFDTTVDARPAEDITTIADLDETTYQTGGMTALYDAVGTTITNLDRAQTETGATAVILCIITDGAENASVEYASDQVKKLVEDRQAAGWEVLFLGANLAAMAEAQHIGVAASSMAAYAGHNTTAVYDTFSGHTQSLRSTGKSSTGFTDDERSTLQDP